MPEVPPERILDLFTRIDNLLVLNLEATKELTKAINKLSTALAVAPPVAPPVPPPVVPPPRIVVTPAPAELVPLTSRLDSIDTKLGSLGLKLDVVDKDLGALQTSLEEYRKRDLQGRPVAILNRVSDYSETTYKKVAEWRVGDTWGLNKGRIQEISVATSDYDVTEFKLTVMGKVFFKDKKVQAPFTLPFPPHDIPKGERITIECRSDGATSITVDGSITGKEFG